MAKITKKDGPKGVRTLDLHNAIVALSQIELWALVGVVCHPLIARNGRTRRSLLATGFDRAAPGRVRPVCSSWAPAPGLHPSRLAAMIAYCFRSKLLAQNRLLTCTHSSRARRDCQEFLRCVGWKASPHEINLNYARLSGPVATISGVALYYHTPVQRPQAYTLRPLFCHLEVRVS
jgi:hypothetical protein